MGRQPFRQMKDDGTMEEAGASSGGISASNYSTAGQIYAIGYADANGNCLFIQPQMHLRGTANTTLSWSNPHYIPMWSYHGGEIDGLIVRVENSGQAGASLKLGVYSSAQSSFSGGYHPDSLLASTTIDCSSAGNKFGTLSSTITLDANAHYYVGFVWGDSNVAYLRCSYTTSSGSEYMPMKDNFSNFLTMAQCSYNSSISNSLPTDGLDNGSGGTRTSLTRRDSNYLPKIQMRFKSSSGRF